MPLGPQKIQGSHDGRTWEDIKPSDSLEQYLSWPFRRLIEAEAAPRDETN